MVSDRPGTAISPHTLCYLATKGAVEQISRVLAKDLGTRGITVNTISLGAIDSPEFREGKPQNMIDSIAKQSPSKRLGDAEDVAPLVGFLVSPAAQWINGQNIRVDGVSRLFCIALYIENQCFRNRVLSSNRFGCCNYVNMDFTWLVILPLFLPIVYSLLSRSKLCP